MTEQMLDKLKEIDTSKFVDHKTFCVVKANPKKGTWEFVLFGDRDLENQAQEMWNKNDDPDVMFNDGEWWDGRFWFYDPNHSATLTIPSSIAEKFGLEEELAEHLEFNEEEIASGEESADEFTEGFIQIHSHPWEFQEPTEEELLRFNDWNPEILNHGAMFTGWMDG